MSTYHRYSPNRVPQPQNGNFQERPQQPRQKAQHPAVPASGKGSGGSTNTYRRDMHAYHPENQQQKKKPKLPFNSLSGLIPPALYNPKTKKVLGVFSAEDLLLAALIFILMENDEGENNSLIIALIYILASEYIDLPF